MSIAKALAEKMLAELQRQDSEAMDSWSADFLYDTADLEHIGIDGRINLVALAQSVIEARL